MNVSKYMNISCGASAHSLSHAEHSMWGSFESHDQLRIIVSQISLLTGAICVPESRKDQLPKITCSFLLHLPELVAGAFLLSRSTSIVLEVYLGCGGQGTARHLIV